ncbi:MAG: RNA polymerase sigma factor RpoH [Alphaproteobacteria bacterium]|nr:RNA polymerase sigma factor RpoH [Alphaproteobacteria bacterium]
MTTTALTPSFSALPVPAEDGFKRYLMDIRRFPVLSAEEELRLARKFAEEGDIKAAHQLVTSHLRLVAKIAFGFRNYGLPVADLIAEGNIGLMRAVKKFEPERGFRLSTYAMCWIKASITEYVLQSWSLVKIGTAAAQKKLFFNLRRMKEALGVSEMAELEPAHAASIAKTLDVSPADVVTMNRRLFGRDSSLNQPVRSESAVERQDLLADEEMDVETRLADHQESQRGLAWLRQGLGVLDKRERHIIEQRRLQDEPVTLEDLAAEYGISRERVRQIEVKAFEKLKKAVLLQAQPSQARALPCPPLSV